AVSVSCDASKPTAPATAPTGQKASLHEIRHDGHASVARCTCDRCVMREPPSFRLTTIAKPMNRFAACGDPRGRERRKDRKMTKDEMIEWFKSAPMGSRHQRMLWAAHEIARLTGATDGGAYQMLLIALIGAERRLDLGEFNDCG